MEMIRNSSETKVTKSKVKTPIKIRCKELKDGRKSIYLDTYIKGKRSYEFLSLFLEPETDEKAARKNATTMRKAEKISKERLQEWKRLEKLKNAAAISTEEKQTNPKEMLLSDWLDAFYEIQKKAGVKDIGTIKRLQKITIVFETGTRLYDVDRDYCLRFIEHLRCLEQKNGKPLAYRTQAGFLAVLGTALNAAIRVGHISRNPVSELSSCERIKAKESFRDYLTIEEIKALINTTCGSDLVKRAYLFSCYCGLRLGDVKALRWKDIQKNGENAIIETHMAKTRRIIHMPLGRQALKWLPQKENVKIDDYVFTPLNHDLLHKYLQPWADDAGIKKKVTFHTARHSFATMLLTLGVDLYTASKLLGHTSIRHTQRYARIVNQVKEDAIKRIDEAIPVSSLPNDENDHDQQIKD